MSSDGRKHVSLFCVLTVSHAPKAIVCVVGKGVRTTAYYLNQLYTYSLCPAFYKDNNMDKQHFNFIMKEKLYIKKGEEIQ